MQPPRRGGQACRLAVSERVDIGSGDVEGGPTAGPVGNAPSKAAAHQSEAPAPTCDAVCSGRGHNGRPLSLAYRSVPGTQGGVREPDPAAGARPPRLLDRIRAALRARHYSRRTEEAYVAWIRRYIFFHGKRHPVDLGASEVTSFFTSLAVDGHVAASTQNQALSALLFLYRDVLEVDLP
jgi:hypothetical protein